MRCAVIGLGYVGLPLAVAFAEAKRHVIGIDCDSERVSTLREGLSPIPSVSPERLSQQLNSARLSVHCEFDLVHEVDVVCVCVPTPVDARGQPALGPLRSAVKSIGAALRKGTLVIVESTIHPGATDEIIAPILEKHSGLSLQAQDFLLAFSPERENPGDQNYSLSNTPKVVGGTTAAATERAVEVYSVVAERVVAVSSARAAEATKMLENVYRLVNISLINELKDTFALMGVDIWEAIAAAKTKPFGFQPFYPGPGIGGHCIPVDPHYLSYRARELGGQTRMIDLALQINRETPLNLAQRINVELCSRAATAPGRVLLLGAAYKPNVGDTRESPFYVVAQVLLDDGVQVEYHDPYVDCVRLQTTAGVLPLRSVELTAETLCAADVVVILTDHNIIDWGLVKRHAAFVIDTRGALQRGSNV